jgi:hypothetical protein
MWPFFGRGGEGTTLFLPGRGRSPWSLFSLGWHPLARGLEDPLCWLEGKGILFLCVVSTNTVVRVDTVLLSGNQNFDSPLGLLWSHPIWEGNGHLYFYPGELYWYHVVWVTVQQGYLLYLAPYLTFSYTCSCGCWSSSLEIYEGLSLRALLSFCWYWWQWGHKFFCDISIG